MFPNLKTSFFNKINGMGKNKGERFGVEGERFGVEGFEPSLAVENLKYCL